ncbi:MAG: glycosyltransferase [Gammaproteobacteria bacterium]
MLGLALGACALWLTIALLPWRPWATSESLDALVLGEPGTFSDTTILIPARNEANVIAPTLSAVAEQGTGVRIILVDDRSTDDTVSNAQRLALRNLQIIASERLPSGWTGKLWALEQGRKHVETEYLLLLDADIVLAPGTLAALRAKMDLEGRAFVSLLAELSMHGFWGKLLLPAFVYFFKLLYPFRLANSGAGLVAAAAGGCILTRTQMIESIGGFGSIKNALIDDCALARRVKSRGARTWIGLTHSAKSARPYPTLATIWNMVARTAFAQLLYSNALLLLCTAALVLAFLVPVIGAALFPGVMSAISVATVLVMLCTYAPVLRYYRIPYYWALGLPLGGVLFMAMTWTSALRHWLGRGAIWKGRSYTK